MQRVVVAELMHGTETEHSVDAQYRGGPLNVFLLCAGWATCSNLGAARVCTS